MAHSYGGLIIREFALLYPAETAGLVLVDTPDEPALCRPEVQKFYERMRIFVKIQEAASRFGLPRLLRKIPSMQEALWFVRPDDYAAAADDLLSLRSLDCSSRAPGQLRDLPSRRSYPWTAFSPGHSLFWKKAGWRRSIVWPHFPAGSSLTVAHSSNHMIHLDQPELVIDLVRQMHGVVSQNSIDSAHLT